MLVVVRGDLSDTIVPQVIGSEGMDAYFGEVQKSTAERFVERVDNWSVSRGQTVNPDNFVEVKKDIVKLAQGGLGA